MAVNIWSAKSIRQFIAVCKRQCSPPCNSKQYSVGLYSFLLLNPSLLFYLGSLGETDSPLCMSMLMNFFVFQSLRGTLLAGGYFFAALSACTMVGLLVLGTTINSEKKQ